jgi:hypothetical protein
VVFVLVVFVAFPEFEPPDPDPDADRDADGVIVVPDREPEADWLADVLEASSAVEEELSSLLSLSCRRTSKASILLSREPGHGQAEENAVKRRRRAAKVGKRPKPFMSNTGMY